ncbi:MAG TPA: sulfur carrier protein ThiS [Phycisphaerae bacterium]|nr:sulfur carrier protein ThiS [Phycisphaerae bacterium]
MELTVNGEKIELPQGATVQHLLDRYKLQPVRVAVELNRDIVAKRLFTTTTLAPGDMVEIVTFVGGG